MTEVFEQMEKLVDELSDEPFETPQTQQEFILGEGVRFTKDGIEETKGGKVVEVRPYKKAKDGQKNIS